MIFSAFGSDTDIAKRLDLGVRIDGRSPYDRMFLFVFDRLSLSIIIAIGQPAFLTGAQYFLGRKYFCRLRHEIGTAKNGVFAGVVAQSG